jgi:hypothetical protein
VSKKRSGNLFQLPERFSREVSGFPVAGNLFQLAGTVFLANGTDCALNLCTKPMLKALNKPVPYRYLI